MPNVSRNRRFSLVVFVFVCTLVGVLSQSRRAEVSSVISNKVVKLSAINGFAAGTSVAAPKNSTMVKFQPGRELQLDGVTSGLRAEGIDVASAEPLSLASDDINGDGYPDLVTGYRSSGGGFLVVYYGNEQAYSPSDEEILRGIREETRFPMPFESARIIRLDSAPEMLVTGDFDRDGLKDIVSAMHGGSWVELAATERENGFRGVERVAVAVAVAGSITAIGAGQISAGDANADLVVGVGGEAALLIYGSNESILTQRPEIRPIAGAAERIAFGDIDSAQGEDIVVASGSRIFVMQGGGSGVDTIELPSRARDIALGEFVWDRESRPEIAVVGDDKMTRVIANGRLDTRSFTDAEVLAKRRQLARIREGEITAPAAKVGAAHWRIFEELRSNGSIVLGARFSTQPSDDLIVMERAEGDLDVITRDKTGNRSNQWLSTANELVSVLPMRLSVMGIPGMVLLQKGKIEPTIVMAAPQASFAVDTAADNAALTACTGAATDCSLRGAIIASNALAGADIITFNAGINPQLTVTSGGNAENAAATGDLDVNGSLTITGNSPTALTTTYTNTCGDCKLFGMDQTGGFPGINVSISGMTMSGGFNNGAAFCGTFFETGGGIDFFLQDTGNVFSLSNSTLSGNTVTGCGQSHGGGINIDSVGAVDAGGASSGTVTLTGNTISSNSAAFHGGGVNMFSAKHDVTMTTNSVTGNISLGGDGGGGIRIRHTWGGTVTINGGGISSNSGLNGGGILIDGNQVANIGTTTGVGIQNNNATGAGGFGGGVAITNLGQPGVTGSTQCTSCTITGNHADNATGKGGGVYFLPAYSATFSSSSISSNTAPTGAGVFNGGAGAGISLTINSGSNIATNAATGAGGGFRNEAATSTTNLDGVTINSNTSGSGGDGIDQNAGAMNLSGLISVVGDDSINLTAGTFTSTATLLDLKGSLTRAAGATFLHNSGTVNFSGTGAQNLNGTASSISFNNFTVNKGGGTLQAGGSVTSLPIAGNVLLTAGTFAAGTATAIGMTGPSWTDNLGDFLAGSSVVTFNGSAAQTITGSSVTTFNGLTINNAAGVTMNQNETVNGALTLTSGELTVSGTNVLSVGASGTTTRTAGHVNGRLKKTFSAPASYLYHVGTPLAYSPATASVTVGSGDLTMMANTGTAPATPAIPNATTLNRYWELLETGALTASLTFNYLNGDIDAGTEPNFRLLRSYGAGVRSLGFSNIGACPGAGTTCVDTAANTIFQSGVVVFDGFWTAGAITVPTASTASIAGRVVDPQGRGLGRVRVVVTDQAGNARAALTSAFGYYSVEDLAVGQTYVVAAQSKRYTFTPRTISLGEDATGFDLTAEP